MHVVDSPYITMFLTLDDEPTWIGDLRERVLRTYYPIRSLPGDEPIDSVLLQRPDALIAGICESSKQLFRQIMDDHTYPHRPLLAFIADSLNELDSQLNADLVLPPFESWIITNLAASLQVRAESLALLAQQQRLSEEIIHLNRQLEKEKRSTDEINVLKNAIVRNVSHELKTPLLHVKSAVSMMAEDNQNSQLAEYATEATTRLEAVIRNITQLADGLETNLGPVLARDAIDLALRNLRRSWENKHKLDRVDIFVKDHLPPVLADKQGLGIVLQLLIDNALKFSKDRIEVRAERSANQVLFQVKDYGIGIAKDQIDKIFDVFYQIDSSTTRRFGGTGVGLAIVRLILDHHGTTIRVESQEGRGSTFSFAMPIAEVR